MCSLILLQHKLMTLAKIQQLACMGK